MRKSGVVSNALESGDTAFLTDAIGIVARARGIAEIENRPQQAGALCGVRAERQSDDQHGDEGSGSADVDAGG